MIQTVQHSCNQLKENCVTIETVMYIAGDVLSIDIHGALRNVHGEATSIQGMGDPGAVSRHTCKT